VQRDLDRPHIRLCLFVVHARWWARINRRASKAVCRVAPVIPRPLSRELASASTGLDRDPVEATCR
jgi:hypothetical protein